MRQFIHMEASTVQEASKNAAKGNAGKDGQRGNGQIYGRKQCY